MSLGRYEYLEKGDIIGSLEVLEYSHTDAGRNRWFNVLCACGSVFKASAWRLKKGHTKSCGCLVTATCILRNINTSYKERSNIAKKVWKVRSKRMQAVIYPNDTTAGLDDNLKEMVEKPVDYNQERMISALEEKRIKEVRVFRKTKSKIVKASRKKNR